MSNKREVIEIGSDTDSDVADVTVPEPVFKGTPTKKKKKSPNTTFWSIGVDDLIEKNNCLEFVVHGEPVARECHAVHPKTKHTYNPSSHDQDKFDAVVREIIGLPPGIQRVKGKKKNKGAIAETFYKANDMLSVELIFRMKRPDCHFIKGRYKTANDQTQNPPVHLKESAPKYIGIEKRIDIDNMQKFTLDAMTNSIYPDDKQIVKVQATKLYDNASACLGSTHVRVKRVQDSDLL